MSGPAKNFVKEDTIKKQLNFRQFYKKTLPYLLEEKRKAIFVLGYLLCTLTLARFIPVIFGWIIDDLKDKNIEQLYTWIWAFVVIKLSHAFFQYYLNYQVNVFGNKVLFNVREKVISHLQALPIQYFDKTPVGRTVTRITNDVLSLGIVLTQGLTGVFLNIFEVIAIFITLLFISAPLTLIIILVVPAATWVTLTVSKKLRKVFQKSKRKLAAINSYSAETLNGIKVIQLYHQEAVRRNRMKQLSQEKLALDMKSVGYFAQLWPLMSFFNFLTLSMGLFFGGLLYKDLGLTVGSISAFLVLLQGFFQPLRNLLERYNQYQDALAGADRVFELLEEPQEPSSETTAPFKKLHGGIEFKGVSFKYEDDGPDVLKNVSFKIEPGQSVALVGRTGSGKTTITALLQKFYNLKRGEILIDGHSIHGFSPQDLRSRIGMVMQDNFIFRGTIKSNITLTEENIPDEVIRDAAQKAHCKGLIESREKGLDATVEERGGNLSVGEKQLISFARALAHGPDILILDEATANIDSHSEKLIQQSIEEITAERTSLIIAHRLSTILHCDKIILLENGEIQEEGSHHELLSKQGKYFNLYNSQYH